MAAFACNLIQAFADYAALAGSAEVAAALSEASWVASAFAAGYGVGTIIEDRYCAVIRIRNNATIICSIVT